MDFTKKPKNVLKRRVSESAASRRSQFLVDVALNVSDAAIPPYRSPASSPVPFRRPSPAPSSPSTSPPVCKRPRVPRNFSVSSATSRPRVDLSAPCTKLVAVAATDIPLFSMKHEINEAYEVEDEVVDEDVLASFEPKVKDKEGDEELLMELEIGAWGETREPLESNQVYVYQVVSAENSQQDYITETPVTFAESIESSMIQSTSTHQVVTSADVHVSADEETNGAIRPQSVVPSTSESAVNRDDSDVDIDFEDEIDVESHIASAQEEIQRELPCDEELSTDVAASIRAMEAVMDADHERLLSGNVNFEWHEDFTTFNVAGEQIFQPQNIGAVKFYDNPYDAFVDIFDEDIMMTIVTETNRYAQQVIDKAKADGTFTKEKRMYRWKDTSVDELYRLFSIFIYMGICQRTSLIEYWKKGEVIEMPHFRKLMSLNRYVLLNKCLHFSDNEKQATREGVGSLPRRLYKLHPIISHLNKKFQELYVLNKFISVDESLTLFKGRLSFVQYIKTKAARLGIKSFELCESRTGYLSKFIIYTGADSYEETEDEEATINESRSRGRGRGRGRTRGRGQRRGGNQRDTSRSTSGAAANNITMAEALAGKTTQIVLNLLQGLENKGYHVTMDNFYNSPALARYLKFCGFDCLGTLRLTRKNVPDDIKKLTHKSERGTIVSRHSGDVMVLSWKDVRVVSMISTSHDNSTYINRRAGEECVKPVCVRDYNLTMGGIDLKDQKLSMYLMERKRGIKWYMKLFKRLMNTTVHNAYVMFNDCQRKIDIPQNKLLTHRQARYEIALALARRYSPPVPPRSLAQTNLSIRLDKTLGHLPIRGTNRRCAMCSLGRQKQARSSIQCNVCDVALCVLTRDCFHEYHTLERLPEPFEARGRKRGQGHRQGRGRKQIQTEGAEPTTSNV